MLSVFQQTLRRSLAIIENNFLKLLFDRRCFLLASYSSLRAWLQETMVKANFQKLIKEPIAKNTLNAIQIQSWSKILLLSLFSLMRAATFQIEWICVECKETIFVSKRSVLRTKYSFAVWVN